MELSEEQQSIYDMLVRWSSSARERGAVSLAGLAGTGKTTLVAELRKHPRFRYWSTIAPTGKAAVALRRKGIHATTIHQACYTLVGQETTGNPVFEVKSFPQGRPDGLLVDEASMVNQKMYTDLMRFHLPIIWVGDHGQLEPVGDDPGIMRRPTFVLSEIHRQAAGNPIIQVAHALREGQRPSHDWSVESKLNVCYGGDQVVVPVAKEFDVDIVITPFHTIRHRVNTEWRATHGRFGEVEEGDRIVCLRNNWKVGVFNGETFRVREIVTSSERAFLARLQPDWSDDMLDEVELFIARSGFGRNPTPEEFDAANDFGHTMFDFAYALTCHKAQGSEWKRVAVVDRYCSKWSMQRWRYTACTRAAEYLVIVGSGASESGFRATPRQVRNVQEPPAWNSER